MPRLFARTRIRSRWLAPVVIALVATGAANVLVLWLPWFGYAELGIHHRWLLRTPLKANPEIVLVEIKRETPRKLGVQGRGLPLPRNYHAALIGALRDAGAHALVFDLLFIDPSAPAEDKALRQALATSRPLHVTLATEEEKSEPAPEAPTGWKYWFDTPVVLPAPLPSNIAVASAKAYDPGGMLDGAVLLRPDENTGRMVSHLALDAVLSRFQVDPATAHWDKEHEQVTAGSFAWRVGADGELHARWTQGMARFTHFEYADALAAVRDVRQRDRFRDKIVIVGDVSGSDFHRTPLGRMSGLEFVAHVTNTLLLPEPARGVRWRIPMNALWGFLLALTVTMAVRTLRLATMTLGIGGALLAATLIPALALSVANAWIDTVGPCLAVILATGLEALREDVRARRFMPTYVLRERPETLTESATVLFVDVKGSTPMAEKLGSAAYQQVMGNLLGQMADAVLADGAEVDRTLGDGLMAVFREADDVPGQSPGAVADWSHHALRCLHSVQELETMTRQAEESARSDHGVTLGLTMGFESGVISSAVVRGKVYEEWKSYGTTVNMAARLLSSCGALDKSILCGPGAWSCIRQAVQAEFVGTINLKGIKDPVPAYSLDPEQHSDGQPGVQEDINDKGKVVPTSDDAVPLAGRPHAKPDQSI